LISRDSEDDSASYHGHSYPRSKSSDFHTFLGQNNKFVFGPVRHKIAKKQIFACNQKKSFSQKHSNIINNVKLLHFSVTSNHHQAHISVRGHDMFSASENTLGKILKY